MFLDEGSTPSVSTKYIFGGFLLFYDLKQKIVCQLIGHVFFLNGEDASPNEIGIWSM
ncbi:hypothetical protein [Niallia nealsonii]|uniref:hypothetical protein n=1 Tax=Niallia nealsonii TaxID=115979 RepID=UPI0012FF274D|nr:hypothetical protein [Niallia nealsonii]